VADRRVAADAGAVATNGRHPVGFTAAQLMRMELPAARWAVEGLLPEGLTLCCGRPKIGKSWLGLGIAVAVASGGRALGKVAVEAGDVLFLALEDTPRRLKTRLAQLLDGAAAPERLHLFTEWPLLTAGGLPELSTWLSEHPTCRLVVVDTLAKIRGARRPNGDVYGDDYAAIGALKAVADRHAVAVLVFHHQRKGSAEDWLDTINGSTGLGGAADGVMILSRQRGRGDAVLLLTGRDCDEQELAVEFTPETGLWSILGDAAQYRLSQERAAILDVLQDAGEPLGPSQVARALGKEVNVTKLTMRRMWSDGQIQSVDGKYTLSNHGNLSNRGNRGNRGNRSEGGDGDSGDSGDSGYRGY
jgi:AAA domain